MKAEAHLLICCEKTSRYIVLFLGLRARMDSGSDSSSSYSGDDMISGGKDENFNGNHFFIWLIPVVFV